MRLLADSFPCSCMTEGLTAYWMLREDRPGSTGPCSSLPHGALYRHFRAGLFVLRGQQESLSHCRLLRQSHAYRKVILGVTYRHLGHVLGARSKSYVLPTLKGRGLHKVCDYLGCVHHSLLTGVFGKVLERQLMPYRQQGG